MATFDETIRSFVSRAASDAPTPGGGSVAALVAALGASMTSMVGNLTQGAKFSEVEPEMKAIVAQMEAAITSAERLLEADMLTFDRYMSALKLPKDTEEQKAIRAKSLQEATENATEVPTNLAQLCLDALQASKTIAKTANKNVISDLGIAAFLLEAAAQSALLTVDINLPGLKNIQLRTTYQEKRDQIESSITSLRDEIVTIVRERLA